MSSNHDRDPPGAASDDAAVTRAWRRASDEQPPAGLDAGIVTAARQSVQEADAGAKAPPVRARARSGWMPWQPLAAAATVAGLAFVLVQTLPRDREVTPPIRMEAPTSAPAPEPAPDAALETRSSAPPREAAEVAADIADSIREAETDQRKGVMTEAPGEAYSAEATAPAAARAVGAMAAPSAAERAARIEALHAAGDLTGAAEALRAFRAADPQADTHLPESLRDWARSVE